MTLQMRPATTGDIPDMVAVYFSAFRTSPVTSSVFPESSPSSHKFWTAMLTEEMADPRAHFFVVVDAAASSADSGSPATPAVVIAFAKWLSPPLPSDASSPSVGPPPQPHIWPWEGNPAFADRFFTSIALRHAGIMGDTPHWYLELIACRAEHQGRGAGGMLMRWGCARADEGDGSVCFLEAMAGAKGMYEKFGFVTVERMDFDAPDGKSVSQDFMLREGRATETYRDLLGRSRG